MFSNAISSLLSIFGDDDPRHVRLQALMLDVQQMEESLSVSEFSQYFEALKELKILLIEELNDVYGRLRRANLENERLSIMVGEKNKAVEIMANANVEEKEELIQLKHKLRLLEQDQTASQDRELKLRKAIATLRKQRSGEGHQANGTPPRGFTDEPQ